MADIRPFMSIRPEKGKAAKIAALPYDVYNRKEATEEVEKNPESFLKIDRAETGYPLSVDMYDDRVYERAHDLLWGMVEDGSFIRDQKSCYYIYELTMNGRVQTGITACASIDDYLNGVIKKHENTRAEKEADRIHHVDVCNAQTGPIFLAYRSDPVINGIVAQVKEGEPEYDFISEDGIRHRVFVIDDDEKIAAVSQAFENMADIYIADGHHRAAGGAGCSFGWVARRGSAAAGGNKAPGTQSGLPAGLAPGGQVRPGKGAGIGRTGDPMAAFAAGTGCAAGRAHGAARRGAGRTPQGAAVRLFRRQCALPGAGAGGAGRRPAALRCHLCFAGAAGAGRAVGAQHLWPERGAGSKGRGKAAVAGALFPHDHRPGTAACTGAKRPPGGRMRL